MIGCLIIELMFVVFLYYKMIKDAIHELKNN